MRELEFTIRNWSDAELVEVLEDPEAYEPDVFAIARGEIERRGGADALVAREHARKSGRSVKAETRRAILMPPRARITAWVCIALTTVTLLAKISNSAQLTLDAAVMIFFSTAILLLSIIVLRASLVGIALFSGLMTLIAAFILLTMAVRKDPAPGTALVVLPLLTLAHLLAAALVFSCWKDARRIQDQLEDDRDDETEPVAEDDG